MHNFLGHDGFVWWIGQVVSIDDPMTLGRCRVRIFGYHGEAKDIPDEDLPWAVSIHPVNTPNLYGTPSVGDFVFGFFLDALAAQEPAMLGYFPYSTPEGSKSFSTVVDKNSVVLDVDGNVTISAGNTLTIKDKNGQYTIASLTAAIAAAAASGEGGGGTIVIETGGGSTINLSSVTQSILPSQTETYDLGSNSRKWRSLYVSGSTIYIGGNALSINDNGALLINDQEIESGVADGSITAAKIASNAITSTKIASGAISADKIADGAITNAKLSQDFSVSAGSLDFGTSAVTLAKGTTAQRPESPVTGMFRFNTTTDGFEFYTANSEWLQINSLQITNVSPTSFDGTSGTSFTITGTGFTEGCQVRFVTAGGTEVLAGTVAVNSLTQITATTGRNFLVSEEPLSVKITNPGGISVTLSNAIDTGGSPAWANTAGSLGTVYADEEITPITLLATDPDGQSITYEYTSGAIPTGLTSTATNSIITLSGTPANTSYNASGVTHNFEITASDGINEVARSFSILRKWYDGSTSALAASSAQYIYDLGITDNGNYYYLAGNMAEPLLLQTRFNYLDSKHWVLVFSAPYFATATINHIDKNIPMKGFLIQQDNPANQAYSYLAVAETFSTRNALTPTTTGGNKSGYRLFLGYGGGHGFYNTGQQVCNWSNSTGSVGAGYTGSSCGTFPNGLYWGTGTSSATYSLINDTWESLIWWE